jgi:hypothetical protein
VLRPVGDAGLPAIAATFVVDTVVLLAVWLAMRPGRADVRSRAELERVIHAGRPVVVELYSNFCLICMANRQQVKAAAETLGSAARVVRIELPTRAGAEIGEAYGCRYTPSFLVFDEHGDLMRTVIPDNVTPLANGYRVLDERRQLMNRLPRVTGDDLVAMVRTAG